MRLRDADEHELRAWLLASSPKFSENPTPICNFESLCFSLSKLCRRHFELLLDEDRGECRMSYSTAASRFAKNIALSLSQLLSTGYCFILWFANR
jgi:hypothetical protein